MDTITLENNKCNNMAGIYRFAFADHRNITNILPYQDTVIMYESVDTVWYELNSKLITVESRQIGARAYEHTVTIKIAKNEVLGQALSILPRKRYIGKIYYNNETVWLIGTREEPLRLTIDDTSDGTADGETIYTLTFRGQCTKPQLSLSIM